ncbi:MAG: hypothetical protein JNK82_16935 [Myxococcaceae bacterium]|nr:hypothetical protein [Myxococcaceae bacterium]
MFTPTRAPPLTVTEYVPVAPAASMSGPLIVTVGAVPPVWQSLHDPVIGAPE